MLDLRADSAPPAQLWRHPARFWPRLTEATAHLPAPVAVIDLDALRYNAMDLLARAGGVPIRVATKSVRVRAVLDAVLSIPGYQGLLAFTLEEALWLAETHDDIVVGYPSADRASIARLAADEKASSRITLMIDSEEQLDFIDSIVPPTKRPVLRVALDVDASFKSSGFGHVGVRRSPLFSPADAGRLGRIIAERDGFRLVGVQMYEAQLAGVVDKAGVEAPVIRMLKSRSSEELRARRAQVVDALLALVPLEFVNGGGTGSLEFSGSDGAVTESTAGSGLLAGHLFDGYRSFRPAPAAAVAFDVVRRPTPDIAVVLGGGWIASGPAVASRQPLPAWPAGLRTLPREAAGEVQTPLQGKAAKHLQVGDRVWMRHSKSGEAAERTKSYHLVSGDSVIDELPTYRGEGKAFL